MSISDSTRAARKEAHLSNFDVADSGCWIWAGRRNPVTDYGMVGAEYAHRYIYIHAVGEIPNGLTIDHLCRVRSCVNPDHLEPVSLIENIMRSDNPMAHNSRKTHCIRGHEFTPENTKVTRTGTKRGIGRQCRECAHMRDEAHRAKVRAARRGATS